MTVGLNPLSSVRRRAGQRQLQDGDDLTCTPSAADSHDVVATQIDAIDRDVNTEDAGGEGTGKIIFDHGVQAGELFLIVVTVDGGLLNERVKLDAASLLHGMRLAAVHRQSNNPR